VALREEIASEVAAAKTARGMGQGAMPIETPQ